MVNSDGGTTNPILHFVDEFFRFRYAFDVADFVGELLLGVLSFV